MTHQLPALPYAHHALEPYIDAATMEIHHTKHHQAYVDNLNKAIAGTELEQKTLDALVAAAGDAGAAVRNNAGGHWNHSFFWQLLSPNGGGAPEGELAAAINSTFGSFEHFKEQFNVAAVSRFGSGWAWLIRKADGRLAITSTPNQDNPLMDVAEVKGWPIIGVDVWEHAYYLHYQNRRADYLAAFCQIVNWGAANKLYTAGQP